MVRIGYFSDTHVCTDNPDSPGAGARMTEDIRSLFTDYDVNSLYFNGDQVAPNDGFEDNNGNPHSKPAYYNKFWDLVDDSGFGERIIATPGNHECPLQDFIRSDERARLRYKTEFDGVTLLMMNTSVPAWVTGGFGAAYGWNNGYVSQSDLEWMDEQLNKAGDNAKMVFFHHHAWLTPGDPVASAPGDTETMHQANLYEVCRNYQAIHDILSSYDKVIVPQGHTFQFTDEGSSNVDGVEYLYKKHYYSVFTDTVTTYEFIDVSPEKCTVTTVDHNTGDENVILNKNFN